MSHAQPTKEEAFMGDEYKFKLERIVVQALVDKALLMNPDRFKLTEVQDLDNYDAKMVRWLVDIATQEEPLCRYPATWWQHFKQARFPKWLLRQFPVEEVEVIAIHKFPELSIPDQVLGREFVHLRLVNLEELAKEKEDEI